ncbi:27032_t:CDS:2, partial [Dentiscutata erythropus]
MSDATNPPSINIVVSIGLAAVTLNTICSIYVIYRTLNRWRVTKRPLSMSFRVPMYIAITVVGGLLFFGVLNNMSLVGSLALLTYFRTCQRWYINLGKYDYKLFAIISLISFILTLIGVPSFGPGGFWCNANHINSAIPIILIIINNTIILITLFCYIATLREVNFQQKAVQNINTQSKLSRVEIIVTRKITGYILIFLLQWTPTIFYAVGHILGVSGNLGGVGNMILFLINEKWKDDFNSLTINSETLTGQSDECINNGNISHL